jgi:hypothetical protein
MGRSRRAKSGWTRKRRKAPTKAVTVKMNLVALVTDSSCVLDPISVLK